ncbi:MAG: DUF1559 domain-containing protein [Pirellulaceae bacterium]|nr:DUF1559 domain-containing protein [Pirellulaceae bacterium]
MTDSPPTADNSRPAWRFTLRGLLVWIVGLSLLLAVVGGFLRAVNNARRQAHAIASQGAFNQLLLALHNYHDQFGSFPPAYVPDGQGRPKHSWRVLILPYVEQLALYEAYDFTEPWDGPNNSRLLGQMPRVFATDFSQVALGNTQVVAVTGPGTAFPGASVTRLFDLRDGAENTLMLVEATNPAIPWLAPRDLEIAVLDSERGAFAGRRAAGAGSEEARISGPSWRRPYVVFADRITAYGIDPRIPRDKLRALLTIAGGEAVRRDDLVAEGWLD